MRKPLLILCFLIAWASLSFPHRAYAQLPDRLSNEARISLITVLPGEELYSLFGHSAFRVYDPVLGLDELFNYGTFDFRDPLSFAFRFAYGKLDYMLSSESYPRSLYAYATYEHRPVIEQVLNLSPDQAQSVYHYLSINALPENRTYRYDFLFDNCSTRLRDVLEITLGDDIRFAPVPNPEKSFRHLLDPYVADRPFLDLGFDLLLGVQTDRVASPKEATFLPLILMESFEHATVQSAGNVQPLVARTDTVYWTPGADTPKTALPWASILMWIVFIAGAALTASECRSGRHANRYLDALVFGVAGVVGLVATFMWFFTEHNVTTNNMNLLWAWPTHLIVVVLLWRRSVPGWLQVYFGAAAAVNVLTVALWWAWPQQFHSAILPIILLLAIRSTWRAYQLRHRVLAERV